MVAAAALLGCEGALPKQPPGVPPTPKSITRANPGGDAADPELAALERLVSEPWGVRKDRWQSLRVPVADWKNWRRVKLTGYPMRASFRYGDDHYAVGTVWYTPSEGPDDPQSCLDKFMRFAKPIAKLYEVKMGPATSFAATQVVSGDERPMVIQLVDGSIDSLLASDDYVGAIAAYQSWPGTCLIHAFAVVATEHREVATKIRDRWVAEGAPALTWEKKILDKGEAPETTSR